MFSLGTPAAQTRAGRQASAQLAQHAGHHLRQDLLRDFLDARPLDQRDGRDLDADQGFEPVRKRHRHQRIETQFAQRASRLDHVGDAQRLHRLLPHHPDKQVTAPLPRRLVQLSPDCRSVHTRRRTRSRAHVRCSTARIAVSCGSYWPQRLRRQWLQ